MTELVANTESAPPSTAIAKTDRIYVTLKGNFVMLSTSIILSITGEAATESPSSTVRVVLEKSPFHPQGGGQPTDKGIIFNQEKTSSIEILKVEFDFATEIVTHIGTVPTSQLSHFIVGGTVNCEVDEANRYLLSQCHSAGHLIDSAMARVGQTFPPTKGYHFLDGPYVEYKGKVDAKDRDALVEKLRAEFDAIVEEDIPTSICQMTKNEAELECNRIQKNFDFDSFPEPIRIVSIANFKCPCGGTHVKSTKHLKDWTVLKIKAKKDKVQVRYGLKSELVKI